MPGKGAAFKPERSLPGEPLQNRPLQNQRLRVLRWKWLLRRYSLKLLWYRLRLPLRRRRWKQENTAATRPYSRDRAFSGEMKPGSGEPVLIVGDFSGSYGLSRGAAYDAHKIAALHTDVTLIDTGPYLYGGADRTLPTINRSRIYGTAYFLCQPDTWSRILPLFAPEQLDRAWRIGRWVWETPRFPGAWEFALNLTDEIWTPSQFCADMFAAATGLPVKVWSHQVAAQHSGDPKRCHERVKGSGDLRQRLHLPASAFSADAFTGLAIMDIVSCPERKNPWAHVEAWSTAFGNDPSALLIIKLRTGKRTRMVVRELEELAAKLATGPAHIAIIDRDLEAADIAALQDRCDVYLSLHRSEGYGLNIAECLDRGRPVLATHWSANAEYGPHYPNYIGIDYTLTPYRDWLNHYEDGGFSWADADIQDAAQHLQRIRKLRNRPL